jgi:glutamate racemase
MTSRPVAVLDSGIGGLPYLSWIQEHLPLETLVYVADAAAFPYGEKTPDAVRQTVVALGRALVGRDNPKLLVVACNTASVLALDALRSALPIPVVGVVPAVKTAAGRGTGTLGVLATPRTVEDGYWEGLVAQFAPGRRVKGYAAPDLVRLVEEGAPPAGREALLAGWAQKLRSDGVDSVVLGCTHYLHLAADLQRLLGPGVSVVDSREGVGRRVASVLADQGLLASEKTGSDRFSFTAQPGWGPDVLGPLEVRYRSWAGQFGLEYSGPWVLEAAGAAP